MGHPLILFLHITVLFPDGCGYVDDGREIFDDDLHDVDSGSKRGSKGKKGGAGGRKESAEKGPTEHAARGCIDCADA